MLGGRIVIYTLIIMFGPLVVVAVCWLMVVECVAAVTLMREPRSLNWLSTLMVLLLYFHLAFRDRFLPLRVDEKAMDL